MPQRSAARRSALFALLLLGVALLPGCGTRTVREKVFVQSGPVTVEVQLREQKKLTRTIERGYQHPVTIAAARMSHVLGAIDIQTRGSDDEMAQRRPMMNAETLLTVSRGISKALEKAGPNQDVSVKVQRKEQRLGVFHRKYYTSFLLFQKEDYIYVDVSMVDWEVPKGTAFEDLPDPAFGDERMQFRVVPSTQGMHAAGKQVAAVNWRDPFFAKPSRVKGLGTSRVRQRTILMDSPLPPDEAASGVRPELVDRLDAETLRAIAELQEARRRGDITESEYRERFNELLE